MGDENRFSKLESKINKTNENLSDLEIQKETDDKRLTIVEKGVEEIKDALTGGLKGDNGIISRMNTLGESVKLLNKTIETALKDKKLWWIWIERSLIAGIIGYLIWLLKSHS